MSDYKLSSFNLDEWPVDSHSVADCPHVTIPLNIAELLVEQRDELLAALKSMDSLVDMMMKQCNIGASAIQTDCLRAMNEAPIQAANAIYKAEQS